MIRRTPSAQDDRRELLRLRRQLSRCERELERFRKFVRWDGRPFAATDTVWIEPAVQLVKVRKS